MKRLLFTVSCSLLSIPLAAAQLPSEPPGAPPAASPCIHVQRVWCERPANPKRGPRSEICTTMIVNGKQGQTFEASARLHDLQGRPIRVRPNTPAGWHDAQGTFVVNYADEVQTDRAIWRKRSFFVPDAFFEADVCQQPVIATVTATCGGLESTAQAEITLRPAAEKSVRRTVQIKDVKVEAPAQGGHTTPSPHPTKGHVAAPRAVRIDADLEATGLIGEVITFETRLRYEDGRPVKVARQGAGRAANADENGDFCYQTPDVVQADGQKLHRELFIPLEQLKLDSEWDGALVFVTRVSAGGLYASREDLCRIRPSSPPRQAKPHASGGFDDNFPTGHALFGEDGTAIVEQPVRDVIKRFCEACAKGDPQAAAACCTREYGALAAQLGAISDGKPTLMDFETREVNLQGERATATVFLRVPNMPKVLQLSRVDMKLQRVDTEWRVAGMSGLQPEFERIERIEVTP